MYQIRKSFDQITKERVFKNDEKNPYIYNLDYQKVVVIDDNHEIHQSWIVPKGFWRNFEGMSFKILQNKHTQYQNAYLADLYD